MWVFSLISITLFQITRAHLFFFSCCQHVMILARQFWLVAFSDYVFLNFVSSYISVVLALSNSHFQILKTLLIHHAWYHFISIIYWNLIEIYCYPLVMSYSIKDNTQEVREARLTWYLTVCAVGLRTYSSHSVVPIPWCWFVFKFDKAMKIMISLPVHKDHDL